MHCLQLPALPTVPIGTVGSVGSRRHAVLADCVYQPVDTVSTDITSEASAIFYVYVHRCMRVVMLMLRSSISITTCMQQYC